MFVQAVAVQKRVAKVLPSVTIAGVSYRVLRLSGDRGPRYLLRNDAGELVGLYPRGAEPMRLYAAPLVAANGSANPLARLEFFDGSGTIVVEDSKAGR